MRVPAFKSAADEDPTYSRSVFEAILAGIGQGNPPAEAFECSADGARVRHPETDGLLAWHPWCEVTSPGSPNPLDEPWLRFPFTARQLAALMVDGWGYFIQEKYGDWESGPDESELQTIGPLGGKAIEALRAAYAAYRHAVAMAPHRNRSLETVAVELAHRCELAREDAIAREELREHRHSDVDYAVRLARVTYAVAKLSSAASEARRAADEAHASWRQAVVQHLLLPIENVSADAFRLPELRLTAPDRRAGVADRLRRQQDFEDSAAGQAQEDLRDEIHRVELEVGSWQLLRPQNITEAARQKDELKELSTRLGDLKARLSDIEGGVGGVQRESDVARESPTQRQKRRLADLRALGGDWVKRDGSWRARDQQSGSFGRLVAQERVNGSRNFSEKSVRLDLCAAAEAEAEMKRGGEVFKGLAP